MVATVGSFLAEYVVLPNARLYVVVGAWVVASRLAELWDRFPHLAITSPEKRCGKTRLLQLLEWVTPNPVNTTNISPAAIYRLIAQVRPTLLLDEAQSLSRRGSESSEIIRELFCAGIDRNAKVLRCGGERMTEIESFPIYCPKVVALIGNLDGVLADRCLPIGMTRKTEADQVEPYRSRVVEPEGKKLHDELEQWAKANGKRVGKVYDTLDLLPIKNDRMAELLLPLQAVLTVDAPDQLGVLLEYATDLDRKDREAEGMSPGVQLLAACREIFAKVPSSPRDGRFLATTDLISHLTAPDREEEPWRHYTRGKEISPEALALLLRPYGIRSRRNRDQSARGYYAHDFEEVWGRYLPSFSSLGKPG